MSAFNVFGKARLALEGLERREVPDAQLWAVAGGAYDLAQTFRLHSNPTASHTIYLDFDGHTTGDVTGTAWDNLTSPAWDPGNNGAAFTDAERVTIQRVWARVAEDYAPFNVDVTTEQPANLEDLRKFGAGDTRWGVRVVITPSDAPAPGAGGVAYVGSFNYANFTPAYVFNGGEKSAAEAASHEAGHALGLGHDGTATSGYYGGHGSGATSWGPIMGASYSPTLSQWSRGEYAGASNTQDDLAVITGNNGFTYRADDFGNTLATATQLLSPGAGTVPTLYGKVERNTDADVFSFFAGAGVAALTVDPLTVGPNLAVQAELYDAAGTLLSVVNPATQINAAVTYTLPAAGQYFLRVSGAAKGAVGGTGFSNYGSLGNYRVTGTVPPYTTGPTNRAPVAVNDAATTAANTPVTVDVLANDSDPDGDALTITGVTNVVGGTATVSNGRVVFTPTAGFSGTGSFTYAIADGRGGTATATASITVAAAPTTRTFTNGADVSIGASRPVTVSSTVVVSGLTGTLRDVNVSLNLFHTYTSDLRITLIAPDGTQVRLFNRHGGSANNLLGTTFDDQAAAAVGGAAAPFTGTFRPSAALAALNGKSPNGTWRLQVEDLASQDGGYLDTWTLTLSTGPAAAAPAFAPPGGGTGPTGLPPRPVHVFDILEDRRRRETPLDHYLAPEADLPRG